MNFLRKLTKSRSGWNAAASYFSFFSVALWGFVSIPVAVAYLDEEQLGIWTVVNAIISYLVWMDMGVGNATGRLIAKSVSDRDQTEINRWWSVTRVVLMSQSALVLLVGLALTPAITHLISPPQVYRRDTMELFAGCVLLTAVFFPIRGTPGLLTAQQRFHWVPLVSGITPWLNLFVFYWLLQRGWGLRSYLFALGFSQLITGISYALAVRLGPDRPRWDRSGLSSPRFRALFGYSSKITVVGIVEAVMKTLPTMIIAKAGGLALVPVYNFASKAALMGYSLASRSYQSFYPSLLRLHVRGEHSAFEAKYRILSLMTLGVGLIGGGMILALNKTLVILLAGEEFFPGQVVNSWFAVSLITFPLSGLLMVLILASGEMGHIAWIYAAKVLIAAVGGYFAWITLGMSGVAGFFAFVPLIGAIYGYHHGGALCGTAGMHRTCRRLAGVAALCGALILLCGYLAPSMPGSEIGLAIGNRQFILPSPAALALSSIPVVIGAIMTIRSFLKLAGRGPCRGNPIT